MSFRPGCGFRIVGYVVRRWVNAGSTFATLVLAVPGDKGERKHELRAFGDTVPAVAELGVGMTVEALGTIEVEVLKNKAHEDIKVDGYPAWIERLTIRTLNVEGSSKPAAAPSAPVAPTPAPGTHGDDDW